MTNIEVKGIQVFYQECCMTQAEAIRKATIENAKNYASGKVDRIKAISYDHTNGCDK